MSEPLLVETTYQCTLDDYKEAMHSHVRSPLGSDVVAICGLVLIVFGVGVVLIHGFSAPVVALISGGVLATMPVALRRLWAVWIKKDFYKHPGFSETVHVWADGEGIRMESDLGRRETKWPAFTRYSETDNLFILYEGARLIRVLPKRAFVTEHVSAFRELLASKVRSA